MSAFIYTVPHSGLMEKIQGAIGPLRLCFNEEKRDRFICVTIVCMETELLRGWEIVPSCK